MHVWCPGVAQLAPLDERIGGNKPGADLPKLKFRPPARAALIAIN